ncbi:MAG: hypothetical protein J0M33_13550 [Anaerolineae bacterium]|nr:hypothetical protein [Anaerolineae bacterium]
MNYSPTLPRSGVIFTYGHDPSNRFSQHLIRQDKQALQRLYEGLFQRSGMIKDGPTDASTTIDEFLYGWPPFEDRA